MVGVGAVWGYRLCVGLVGALLMAEHHWHWLMMFLLCWLWLSLHGREGLRALGRGCGVSSGHQCHLDVAKLLLQGKRADSKWWA